MPYLKRIVCLANSRKMSGRCIAGKEVQGEAWGPWIRPISARPTEELSEEERRYEDGQDPRVGDIIDVPLAGGRPHIYQQENHLIDDASHWRQIGRCHWGQLLTAADLVQGPLWPNGFSSSRGSNDRVPSDVAADLVRSLYLIGPVPLAISVESGWEGKREVRSAFELEGGQYRLKVTDPALEREYLQRANGAYEISSALLCVSLGELFQGFAYKLVAAVIRPDIDQVR